MADYLHTLSQPNPEGWAEALIDSLRVRNFTLCSAGTGYYAFVHRTFLEYFCATEIYERFNQRDSGSQNAISADDLIHNIFGQYWNDDAWREVLVLLASQLPIGFAKQAITLLVELDETMSEKADFSNLFLAADCLVELPERSTIADLDRDLLKRLRSLTDKKELYKSRYSEIDIQSKKPIKVKAIYIEPIRYRGISDDSKKLSSIQNFQEQSIHYIAQYWKADNDTLSWLKKQVYDNQNVNVQASAVKAIAQHWRDDFKTLIWLKERVHDPHNSKTRDKVQEEALLAISQYWKDDPETLFWLKEQVRNNQNLELKEVAVWAVSQYWKDDPKTLFWLQEQARNGQSPGVRQAAMRVIAKYWQMDPDTLQILTERAYCDGDGFIRREALEIIARHWKDDPDTFNLLCEVATQDPFQRSDSEYRKFERNPRQTALEGLLEIAPKNPQVIDLLRDRAANDPDDLLREWATEQLTRIDSQSHET